MQRILVALALTLALPVLAQQKDGPDCDEPQTQAEMSDCAYERLQEADAELNREWGSLRTRLKQAEDDYGYGGWFDTVLEGQRGWLEYRDGQCTAEGYEARGGTMEGMLVAYCKTRLTLDRVRELREMGDSGGLGGGFPVASRLTVETLEAVHSSGTLYRFPKIGGDTPAAARINTYLQTQLLERIPGNEQENPFARAWPEKGTSNGLVSLDYTLSLEHPGILTVEVFREVYGAYITSELDSYHFDAITGQLITLRHLLTPEGLARVDAETNDMRLQKIDAFVAGNEVDGALLRSDPLESEEQQYLYQECRNYIDKEHAVLDDAFRLGQYSYDLVREPCGPKAQWALLDLDLNVERSFARDQKLLSEYGRCLLIERRARCRRDDGGLAPGIYRGRTADREPITLIVEAVDWEGIPSGWYFFNERRERIRLKGSRDEEGNPILIDEDTSPATLRPKPNGGLTWTEDVSSSTGKGPNGESGFEAKTTIGSMQIGQGGETATFSDVRASCGMFRLTLAFGVAAAPVRQCLGDSETRRVVLFIEDGRTTSSSVEPDDAAGSCVVSALSRANIKGLTCWLEASVSR